MRGILKSNKDRYGLLKKLHTVKTVADCQDGDRLARELQTVKIVIDFKSICRHLQIDKTTIFVADYCRHVEPSLWHAFQANTMVHL